MSYSVRKEYFSEEALKEKHGKEHLEALNTEMDKSVKGGYPDAGNGRYTMEAGYKCWYEMAKT